MISMICATTVVLLIVTSLPPPSSSFHLPGALQGGGSCCQKNLRRYSNAVKILHSSSPPRQILTEDPYQSEYILQQRSNKHTDTTETNIIIQQLKAELLALAESTRRGFSASKLEKEQVKRIINKLSLYSPNNEPAAAYYSNNNNDITERSRSTIAGKWTLVYSDAPDITSLDNPPLPFLLPTAKLGRIGQECNPPSIKNVIEWQRPNWVSFLPPFSNIVVGDESSRIIQKVCLEGSATPDQPTVVNLKVVGLELMGISSSSGSGGGGPAAYLESNPITLQGGPLSALQFGKFDILYLDDTMRITKTFQGYFAVNVHEEVSWF